MKWQRFRRFWGRRFAPGEYLGLHLTLGLLVSLVLLAVFLLLTRDIHQEGGWLLRIDRRVATTLREHADGHPVVLHTLRVITRLGGVLALILLAVSGWLILRLRRRRLLAAVWLFAAIAGGLIDFMLKASIDRARPEHPDAAVTETNESFPSGHSMCSVVGYGMLVYVWILRLRQRRARLAVVGGLTALVLLIGFSRMYLRAHYFSDVIGGYCVGAVWLAVCLSGLEVVRRRKLAEHKQQSVTQEYDPFTEETEPQTNENNSPGLPAKKGSDPFL
jgi:membrane-associated phospholipid phosphatase